MNRFDDVTGTHRSLLGGLAHQDSLAWHRFAAKYKPPIRDFCTCFYRLQPADADEVTQRVLIKVINAMQCQTYDTNKGLRKWLKKVTTNAIMDFFREQARQRDRATGDSVAFRQIQNLEAADATDRLAGQLTTELYRDLYNDLQPVVRDLVSDRDWEVYQMLEAQAIPLEVAQQFELSVANVYQIRTRVKRQFRKSAKELLDRLEAEDDLT